MQVNNPMVPPKSIVFVAPRFHTNQVGLVEMLQNEGAMVEFHVSLVGPTEDHTLVSPRVFEDSKVSTFIQSLFGKGGINNPRSFPNMIQYYKHLKSLKVDVLVARAPTRLFSLFGAIVARALGARVLFYTQTPLLKRYSFTRRVITRVMLLAFGAKWFTPVVGNAPADSKEFLPPKGMVFAPFVIPSPKHSRRSAAGASRRVRILSVGKFERRKRHDLTIRAIEHLKRRGEKVDCIIVGEATLAEQKKVLKNAINLVSSLDLEGQVSFLNDVPHDAMGQLHASADLFVLSAESEPASISILEAIAHGTPAICSDTCGTRGYIEKGVTGGVFACGNLDSLNQTLNRIIERMRSGEISSKACVSSYEQGFSANAATPIYRKLLLEESET